MPNLLNMFTGAKKKLFVTEAAQIANSTPDTYVKLPKDSSYMFSDENGWDISSNYCNISKINVTNVNTSSVENMCNMFFETGRRVNNFEIVGLDEWNTSHVNSMSDMFYNTGHNRGKFLILIPATNGNSSSPISNSPENMYGSKVTVYANSPSTDLKFSFPE